MRLIFFGSGEFGLPSFEHLARRHEVVGVVTQPDRPAGRKRQLTATPVAAWAEARGTAVWRIEDVNANDVVNRIAQLQADAAVVIAFGQKLSDALIAAAGRLVVNLHASLLPRFRGAAPINHAMLAGDARTGVSVISLASRMDAGLIYAQSSTEIVPTETAGELHDRLAQLGPAVLDSVLTQFERGGLAGQAQDESRATRAPKLSRADAVVDFAASADQVARRIRGLSPWPGVTAAWHPAESAESAGGGSPVQLKLLRAVAVNTQAAEKMAAGRVVRVGDELWVAAGAGVVRVLELQPPGKRPMSADAFCRGHAIAVGDRFASMAEADG